MDLIPQSHWSLAAARRRAVAPLDLAWLVAHYGNGEFRATLRRLPS